MRKLKDRENELRLDILESLARSQKALAVMLEHMAEVSSSSPSVPKQMLKHVGSLARFQQVLAERIIGMRLRRIVKGKPEPCWLSAKVRRGATGK